MYFVDEFLKSRLHIVQNFAKDIEDKKLYASKEEIS
jgi:methyl-accepting chemotaxis protein